MAGAVTEALRIVRGDRSLLALITFMASLWTVSALVYLYAQALLSERGMPVAQIGIFLSATTLVTALGAWVAGSSRGGHSASGRSRRQPWLRVRA